MSMPVVNYAAHLATGPLVELLARVRRGERIALVEDGRPVAWLTPAAPDDAPPAESPGESDEPRPWRGVFTDLPTVSRPAATPGPTSRGSPTGVRTGK
jgi:antitoxin (DNA-binding transcriptional repressor) of toxin-antitoxin stability system